MFCISHMFVTKPFVKRFVSSSVHVIDAYHYNDGIFSLAKNILHKQAKSKLKTENYMIFSFYNPQYTSYNDLMKLSQQSNIAILFYPHSSMELSQLIISDSSLSFHSIYKQNKNCTNDYVDKLFDRTDSHLLSLSTSSRCFTHLSTIQDKIENNNVLNIVLFHQPSFLNTHIIPLYNDTKDEYISFVTVSDHSNNSPVSSISNKINEILEPIIKSHCFINLTSSQSMMKYLYKNSNINKKTIDQYNMQPYYRTSSDMIRVPLLMSSVINTFYNYHRQLRSHAITSHEGINQDYSLYSSIYYPSTKSSYSISLPADKYLLSILLSKSYKYPILLNQPTSFVNSILAYIHSVNCYTIDGSCICDLIFGQRCQIISKSLYDVHCDEDREHMHEHTHEHEPSEAIGDITKYYGNTFETVTLLEDYDKDIANDEIFDIIHKIHTGIISQFSKDMLLRYLSMYGNTKIRNYINTQDPQTIDFDMIPMSIETSTTNYSFILTKVISQYYYSPKNLVLYNTRSTKDRYQYIYEIINSK